ncbi:MAG: polysaccharide biosynthesis/export family protein [Puniceicoccaceae bacterium]
MRISFIRTVYFLAFSLFPFVGGMANEEASDPGAFYRMQPGDTVQVTVFNEPDLAVSQKLDPGGVIIVPLLGRTTLAGLNLREAEQKLEELFISEEYLISPQVTVAIVNYADQVFYIFGEVNQPGAKTFPEGKQSLDILEAITMAGDLSQYAKRSEIVIRRPVPDENREEKIIVDLEDVLRGNNSLQTTELMKIYPEDIIFVPERLF